MPHLSPSVWRTGVTRVSELFLRFIWDGVSGAAFRSVLFYVVCRQLLEMEVVLCTDFTSRDLARLTRGPREASLCTHTRHLQVETFHFFLPHLHSSFPLFCFRTLTRPSTQGWPPVCVFLVGSTGATSVTAPVHLLSRAVEEVDFAT